MKSSRFVLAISVMAATACLAQAGSREEPRPRQLFTAVRFYTGIANADASGKLVQKTFVPVAKSIPGLVKYVYVDAGGGLMFSSMTYTTKASLDLAIKRANEVAARNGSVPASNYAGRVVARSD